MVTKLSEIRSEFFILDLDPGFGSPPPPLTFYPSRIPDPGAKKAPDPGSESLPTRGRKMQHKLIETYFFRSGLANLPFFYQLFKRHHPENIMNKYPTS